MSKQTTLTAAQWKSYDEFIKPVNLKHLTSLGDNNHGWTLLSKMEKMMNKLHKSGTIHEIHRPEKARWTYPRAWLVLRHAPIFNREGTHCVYTMRPGDVISLQINWDRDVFATFTPIQSVESGYMLSGKHPEMVGLFLPLFDKKTITTAIRLRRKHDATLQEKWIGEETYRWAG